MKKLETSIDDADKLVELHSDHVLVDGIRVEVTKQVGGIVFVKMNGKEYRVEDVFELDENTIRVEIAGYTIDVAVVDPISSALSGSKTASGEIIAPLAGQISSIDVQEGQEVNEGDILLVISAMKMENKITSPIAGRISTVNIEQDENVQSGKLLVIIEPKK